MVSKMLQFVHVFCLIAVICAAPLDQEIKNNQLIEKESIPAKNSDRENKVMSLEPSELLVPTAVEQKRNSELQDPILNPKDKRGKRRKGKRRRNRKGRTRGRKSRKGKGRRKNKNKIPQKQQGKSKSRAGENEEAESPTYTTQQGSDVEEAKVMAVPAVLPNSDSGAASTLIAPAAIHSGSDLEEAKVMVVPSAQSLPLALPNSDSGAASALIAPAAIHSGSDLEEAKVMVVPSAQSLPLALPNSDAGASSALIAPATHLAELSGLVTSPPVTETGASLNPTTKSDQTTTMNTNTMSSGINLWLMNPPLLDFASQG